MAGDYGMHDSIAEEQAEAEQAAGETSTPAGNPARMREENPTPPPPSGGPSDARGGAAAASDIPPSTSMDAEQEGLLPDDQSVRFTMRWQEIQASFVVEPRDSVAQADALVADLMQRLAAGFSNERERLEAQWKVAATYQPKICGSCSPATAHSSIGSFPPESSAY